MHDSFVLASWKPFRDEDRTEDVGEVVELEARCGCLQTCKLLNLLYSPLNLGRSMATRELALSDFRRTLTTCRRTSFGARMSSGTEARTPLLASHGDVPRIIRMTLGSRVRR